MQPALTLAYLSAGVFFMTGLVTGVWKYWHMHASDDSQAPYYVNTAHRASLLYSFAAILLANFVTLSAFSPALNLVGVAVPVFFFGFAISTYVIHGVLRDTDNQFETPHVLGSREIPPAVFHSAMVLLVVGEIGGFAILLAGFLTTLV
ncbi:MAG: hypothetical protein SXQ77_05945 [Halobacteria archaeon]|nr:hypothetical protein [Halobacteria archaeon]